MLVSSGSPLVAGGASAPAAAKVRRIRVVRAFYWQGAVAQVGDELEVPSSFAAEMRTNNKAEYVEAPVAHKAPESDANAGKSRRGAKDAG